MSTADSVNRDAIEGVIDDLRHDVEVLHAASPVVSSDSSSSASSSDSEGVSNDGGGAPSDRQGLTGSSTRRERPSPEGQTTKGPAVSAAKQRILAKRKLQAMHRDPKRKRLGSGAHVAKFHGDDGRKALVKKASRVYLPPEPKYGFINIVDRRSTAAGLQYRVLWKARPDSVTKRVVPTSTWEPAVQLRQDKCGPLLKLVDDWVDNIQRRFPFESYLKPSALAIGVMGAATLNDCTFVALKAAYEALGLTDVVIQSRFEDYTSSLKVDISGGLGWKKLLGFIRYLDAEIPGCVIDRSRLQNLYMGDGTKHAGVIRLGLGDGVYLLGTANAQRVGHCSALEVKWGTYWVWSADKWIPLLDADFIFTIQFVRRLVLLE